MTTPRIDNIAEFMRKRHDIYLQRKAGQPGPWTNDPALRDGRFCNIFRELDTVTIWIRENIRERYADHPHLWFMLAIARYINWPDTLEQLIAGGDTWPSDTSGRFCPERLTYALEEIAKRGGKVYTGAYMIRAESDPNKHWYNWSKHRYIAEIVLGRLWEDRLWWESALGEGPGRFEDCDWQQCVACQDDGGCHSQATLQEVWDKFQQHRYIGWGPFMAYEVVTDLRHTRYLRHAPDIYSWANAGPGAIRGLNRLYGRDLNTKPRPEQTNKEMIQLMQELNNRNEERFNMTFGAGPFHIRFEARDIEHSLCEFDKYERVSRGEGKMRSKYDWRKATNIQD